MPRARMIALCVSNSPQTSQPGVWEEPWVALSYMALAAVGFSEAITQDSEGLYLPWVDLERSRSSSEDSSITLPSRPTYTGNPRRAFSSMAFATAALNAIWARFSRGRLNTCFEG
jgi:hypothetical protein